MSRIRSKGTSPERVIESSLRALGLKYRKQFGPARADFAFPREKVALFVDGCFWHGCSRHYVAPVNNAAYWRRKLANNRSRDRQSRSGLKASGWVVIRVWEHSLPKHADRVAALVGLTVHRRKPRPGRPRIARAAEEPHSQPGRSARPATPSR